MRRFVRFAAELRRDELSRSIIVMCLGAGLALTPALGQTHNQTPRIALLIQNDVYPDAEPTEATDEDASTLASALKKDGFDVEFDKNVSGREMQARLAAFEARVTPKTVALFYFKGIGIQASRQNFLLPVDARIWSEDDVRRQGTSLAGLMSGLDKKGAGVKIAIVDAARPNPFERRFRAYSAGLAPANAPAGSLVILAHALGTVTDAEPGPVSLFMSELARQLKLAQGADVAFARTRDGVSELSQHRDVPWVSSTLRARFDFVPGLHPPSSKPGAVSSAAAPAPEGKPASPPAPPPSEPAPAASAPVAPAIGPGHAAPGETPAAAKPSHDVSGQGNPAKPATTSPPAAAERPQARPAEQKPTALAPRPGSVFSDCKGCPEMIVLAGATFRMGSGTTPFDRPVHEVTIAKPFAIGVTVVTNAQWALCIKDGGCTTRPEATDDAFADRPFVDVTWEDAERYADWLSKKTGKTYRLPTEAEWEYAARGGTTTAFAWGDAVGDGHANCADCGKQGRRTVEPVRTYPKNRFGLFDMAGNVAEWIADCWTPTYRGAQSDGAAPHVAGCKMRVVRGGSFETSSAYIKPTARFRAAADIRSPSIGFRLARDAE